MVANSSTEGKDENSSGLRTLMAIMMISTAVAILKVKSTSSSIGGSGMTSMPIMINTNAGMLRSLKLNLDKFCRIVDSVSVLIVSFRWESCV